MELWRELLIGGLQDETCKIDYLNDNFLIEIIQNRCYNVLLELKKTIEDDNLTDKDCFIKIEKILSVLAKNNIFCDRHDFG